MTNAIMMNDSSKRKERATTIDGERISLYVETNGVVEEHSVLWNDTDVAPQILQPKLANVRAKKWYTSSIDIIKSK